MSEQPSKLTILGAGAWGSALATLARVNQPDLRIWSRESQTPLWEAVAGAEIILSAVSMSGVPSVVEQLQKAKISPNAIFVTATKGLDSQTTQTPSQIWQNAFPHHPVVVLSGPNLSVEIEQKLPAAAVVASRDLEAASAVQQVLNQARFRVYTNADPLGVELGGTLKNVMAIAAGACDGLNLGTNAKAALLTRGLTEIIRIGNQWGAQTETFYGLSGMGDLLATCNSSLSRNYRVGFGLAQGHSLEAVLSQLKGTAEGVNTTKVLIQRAIAHNIYVPITYQVDRLLKGEISAQAAVNALMLRDTKPENA